MTELQDLLRELVDRDLENSPVRATQLGVPGHDDRLGDYSEKALEAQETWERDLLARFEAVDSSALTADESIDLDLAISELRGRAILHDWPDWRRSPDGYLGECLYGAFMLFLHRLRPDAELVDACVDRLAQIPAVLDHARANLDPGLATPELVRRAAGMCQAGVSYVRDFLPAEVGDDKLAQRLADAGARAAAAFEDFLPFLADLADRASGGFALGESRYTRLLEEREALGYGLAELHQRGWRAHDAIVDEMASLAETIAGTRDFRAVVADAQADHPLTPEAMRDAYAEWTARARAFLDERGLVTFPEGERCEVVPSPPFLRPMSAVASYMRPPAFTDSRVGHFNVPYPPDGSTPEDTQQRLAMNNHFAIPTVAVHEAYPGHHWHLAVAAGNPSPVRKVYGSSYMAEGWGLYTEQMMREEGFYPDPRMDLCQLDMRLFRACRIIVDTALHAGDMGMEEAVTLMQDHAGATEPVARAEVLRYCGWPTQAPSYLTGSIELERIRADYLSQGRGDLRSFHDTLAASGVLPLGLAERAVMGG